jgi:hypothetical protein
MILRLADDLFRPTVRLEEAAGWLQVMQEEHREAVVELRALRSSATQVWDLVLRGSMKHLP